jgi:hypothetical protein
MSTAVTMQDLELEHAELLPARETLCVRSFNFNPQVSVASGNNVGSGDNVNILSATGVQNANATATGNNSGAIFTL